MFCVANASPRAFESHQFNSIQFFDSFGFESVVLTMLKFYLLPLVCCAANPYSISKYA